MFMDIICLSESKTCIGLLLVAIRNSIRGLCNKTSIGSAFLAIIMQECCTVEARPTSGPPWIRLHLIICGISFLINSLKSFIHNKFPDRSCSKCRSIEYNFPWRFLCPDETCTKYHHDSYSRYHGFLLLWWFRIDVFTLGKLSSMLVVELTRDAKKKKKKRRKKKLVNSMTHEFFTRVGTRSNVSKIFLQIVRRGK